VVNGRLSVPNLWDSHLPKRDKLPQQIPYLVHGEKEDRLRHYGPFISTNADGSKQAPNYLYVNGTGPSPICSLESKAS